MKIETYSTLPFKSKINFKDFQKKVKIFDFINTLMSLQKLSSFLSNQTGVNINLEFEFHIGPKVKHHILLPKDFISFFAKQCILKCTSSEIKYNDLDLTNLVYEYGNMETDLNHTKSNSKDAWLWILRTTNHQWFYLRLPSSIMGRFIYLFEKVFQAESDLKQKIDSILKLDFFDLLKIGTCIFANFCPRTEGFATSFEMKNFTETSIIKLKPLLTEENLNKFLNVFSINQDGFKEENKKYEVTNNLLKKYEFNPLKRFPIIKTGSKKDIEKFIIPSLSDFFYSCFEGMYYVLLDKLEDRDKGKLFQAFGKQFEKYIGEIIEFYNIPFFSKAQLLSEQTYKDGKNEVKSSDWLIVSESYIFQIECKKRKLDNYSKAGIEDKDKIGVDSLLTSISKELDKFPKKEQHIKEGKIDKIKYAEQTFINIIVYLDEMFALNKYARKEIKSKMIQDTENFYILGCYEFEMLCQHANKKNLNLKNALDDLMAERTEIYSIEFLDKIYLDFFHNLMD